MFVAASKLLISLECLSLLPNETCNDDKLNTNFLIHYGDISGIREISFSSLTEPSSSTPNDLSQTIAPSASLQVLPRTLIGCISPAVIPPMSPIPHGPETEKGKASEPKPKRESSPLAEESSPGVERKGLEGEYCHDVVAR